METSEEPRTFRGASKSLGRAFFGISWDELGQMSVLVLWKGSKKGRERGKGQEKLPFQIGVEIT